MKVCEFFIFFKIHILIVILNNANLTYGKLEKYENKINMLKIFLVILISAHILAILLYSVSYIEVKYIESGNKAWIQ